VRRLGHLEHLLPHRTRLADRPDHDCVGDERGETTDEVGVARAEPRHHTRRVTQQGRGLARLGPELALEAKRVERDRPVHDAERREKLADPGLGGKQQGLEWVPVLQESERRDGEQNVAERSRMDGERQGERSARAASWSRPFVASAVPE